MLPGFRGPRRGQNPNRSTTHSGGDIATLHARLGGSEREAYLEGNHLVGSSEPILTADETALGYKHLSRVERVTVPRLRYQLGPP